VIPVYVLDDETPRHRKMGGASRWWLHLSLQSLSQDLLQHDSRLILRRGRSEEVLADLAEETGAETIHALHHHEPWWLNAEKAVTKAGLDLQLHHGNYLAPPGSVTSGAGTPYRIYTPFWRALQQHMPPPPPVAKPRHIPAPAHWPKSDDLADWHLLPSKPDWAGGFRAEWTPGEKGAHERLNDFIDEARHYGEARNLPSQEGTSRLSPHLAFGEISPAQCWHALEDDDSEGAQIFRSELGWRDYAQNQIVSMPDYGARPANPAFEHFLAR
jgi:deoxyribodipyrimidine photo-lyase